jgi:hypothetical protein
MLVRVKEIPVGQIHEFNQNLYQASLLNWSTHETKYLGDFPTFAEAKKAILAANRKIKKTVLN